MVIKETLCSCHYFHTKLLEIFQNRQKIVLGPQNRPHVPSRTAKSSKKDNLRVLRAVQRCQTHVLVIPDDLPRRPWGCLRASSWDLCPTKRSQLDGFCRKKSFQGASKQRKSEFLKIHQNSCFFNGFPCFLKVRDVSFAMFFYETLAIVNI